MIRTLYQVLSGENCETSYNKTYWFGHGYFTTKEKAEKAVSLYHKYGDSDREVVIKEITCDLAKNQKYIYVLWYMYSTFDGENYTDFEEVFEPQSSMRKCLELKKHLSALQKYRVTPDRIYEKEAPDGFGTTKFELDFVYQLLPKEADESRRL